MAKKFSFKDRVVANAEKQKSRGSQYGYLSLPSGIQVYKEEANTKALLDFIPYEVTDPKHLDRDEDKGTALVGDPWYRKPYLLHRNIGAANEAIVCPTTVGKKCPIHEHRQKRTRDGDASQEEIKAMNAQFRSLYLIVPRDDKKHKEELHIWDIADGNFQKQLNKELHENPENGVFPDPEDGLTLKVRLEEEVFGKNKYAKADRIDFEDRKPIEKEFLEDVPNLDEVLTILSYDEIYAKFFEIDEPPAGDGKRETKEPEDTARERRRDRDKEPEDTRSERRRERDNKEPEDDPRRARGRDREPDKAPDKEPEPDRSSRRRERERESAKDELECPVEEGAFGVKTDKFRECDKCKIWEQCSDERDRREKKGK
jgi:hypothetical protein